MRRLQDITATYHTLQGLKVLPWSVLALAAILVDSILDTLQGQLDYPCLIGVPGVVVAKWLSMRIGRYYDRTFGRVQRTRRDRNRELVEGIVMIILVYAGFFVDSMGRVPVSVLGLVLAAFMSFTWWRTGCFRTHYLVMAALLAVVSLLPLVGVLRDVLIRRGPSTLQAASICLLFIVGSVFDHLVLIRSLKPLPKESHDGDV